MDLESQSLKLNFTDSILGGSWDVISKVISKVTIVLSTYNPN